MFFIRGAVVPVVMRAIPTAIPDFAIVAAAAAAGRCGEIA